VFASNCLLINFNKEQQERKFTELASKSSTIVEKTQGINDLQSSLRVLKHNK
jgi:hypothetical protein